MSAISSLLYLCPAVSLEIDSSTIATKNNGNSQYCVGALVASRTQNLDDSNLCLTLRFFTE